ncbi:MAG: homing endonuclease associated repeat-containing protein [Solirubrobacteraceae bacterium]
MSDSGVAMAGGQVATGRHAGRRQSPTRRPASPPRQQWFVHKDTWDRERVVERCREWARQTGSPPSYYDWGPVARAEAAGAPASLAGKWEREHPDWPAAAVVYRYLRGWRELLSLAGFPAAAVIELPFAERVQEGLRLRADGLRWADIGELLGISPDTARRYVHVHDCERCGEPILARGVLQCRRCSGAGRSRWGKPFTAREIVAAIRAWERVEGRAPAQIDWQPSDLGGNPRWERECPRFPPQSLVTRQFGSWNRALRAAGFDRPRPPEVSDEQILAGLRAYHRDHGTSPARADWRRAGLSPNISTIEQRFGSWNAALTAAELAPRRVSRDWSDPDMIEGLRRFAADHGRPLRASDRVGSLSVYPSPALVVTRYGSLSAGIRKAGLQPGNPPPVTERDIIRALRDFRREHRRSPTSSEWSRTRRRPAAETIIRHCGSWAAALTLASLNPPDRVSRGPDRDHIIARLRAYEREHGAPPSVSEWRRRRLRPGVKPIYRQFGSWPAALAAAGLQSPAILRKQAASQWGEAEIIAALRAHATAKGGTAPDSDDWTRTTATHPSALRVRAVFGSWRQALAAADLAPKPPSRRWSEDTIITLLRADAAANGTAPRASDWDQAADRPAPGTVARVFGSWNDALEASGIGVNKKQNYWTKERILEALRHLERQLGRPPTSAEISATLQPGCPPAVIVARAFGSWRAAARQLGWPQPPRRPSTVITASLREAISEFDQLPSRARWQQLAPARDWPSAHTLTRRYGSWGAVRTAANELTRRR